MKRHSRERGNDISELRVMFQESQSKHGYKSGTGTQEIDMSEDSSGLEATMDSPRNESLHSPGLRDSRCTVG